jgi:hypothetical protein
MTRQAPPTYIRQMSTDNPLGFAAVVRGASRGFGVLLVGGLLQPLAAQLTLLAYVWLVAVAIVAFAVAAVAATPAGTPPDGWRQAPAAAVGGYLMITPLVVLGAGGIPVLQAFLTTATAVVVGAVVGLARTRFDASRASARPA